MYIIFLTIIFAVTQILMFESLPKSIRNLLAYYTILAMALNIALSSFIMVFAGIAYGFGVINITSSLIFGAYIFIYKKKHKLYITKKFLWIFPIIKSIND